MTFASDNVRIGRQRATRLGRALELVTLLVLVLIFVWVAMDRMWRLRVEAERVDLMRTEAALQVALGVFVTEKTLERRFEEIAALDGSNPMALLGGGLADPGALLSSDLSNPAAFPGSTPSNYVGERSAQEGETVDGYHWYFDTTHRELIYVVGSPDHFSGGPAGRARAAFRLTVGYEDANGNGRFDRESERLTAIRLARVAPFEWLSQ